MVPAPETGVETPRKQMATVADGTHHTGMHSCYYTVSPKTFR